MSSSPSLVIVTGDFHQELANRMVAAAEAEAVKAGITATQTITVAGSYETPLVVESVLTQGKADLVVVLGFIEKGETKHGEVMGHVVHRSLIDLSLKHHTPIGIGIIGPHATPQQADVRAEGTARGAVRAALRSWKTIQELHPVRAA